MLGVALDSVMEDYMDDNSGRFFNLNGNVEPISRLDDIRIPEKNVVYEVIRVISGVPLFFEKHFTRMQNSMNSTSTDLIIDENELRERIENLILATENKNCNVKVIAYNIEGKENILIYESKSNYPGVEEISKGVPVGLMHFERRNPNAKIVNNAYKVEAADRIASGGVFEVLLVNGSNQVTEGSKSNVFFISGNKVFTSPGSFVLKGITREYVFEACRRLKIEVIEKLLQLDELDKLDGLFISGTSIKVLPVCSVESYKFKSATNPLIVSIRDCFDSIIYEYIKK